MTDDVTNIEVAVPNRDSTSEMNASLSKTLESLESPDDGDYEVSIRFSYLQPVDANRNRMVRNFLEDPDNDWLLMVDNDVVPPKDILKMVEHDEPVVSGVVTIKKGTVPQPVVLKEYGDQYRQVGVNEYMDEKDDSEGVIEVDGVGTGCLLIRRDVLEDIKPPWFKFEHDEYGGLQLGEDFYFSRRVKQAGYSMYVSTEHVCSHFKTVDLTEIANLVADYQSKITELESLLDEHGIEHEGTEHLQPKKPVNEREGDDQ